MSEMELGVPFDIHGGATDLIFPHHENELAQSEAATGREFVRYWMHGGLLQVNAEKMSKSLGNFLLLKDVLDRYPAPVVRLLMLQTHYRSPLDFSTDRLDEARAAYERLANMVRSAYWVCRRPAPGAGAPEAERTTLVATLDDVRARFDAEMDDDFNSAGALGALFELARAANGFVSGNESALGQIDLDVLATAADAVVELLAVLGVAVATDEPPAVLPAGVVALAAAVADFAGDDPTAAVAALIEARASAREQRDWARADAVRDGLAALGVRIEDTPGGARVTVSAG
jgi:cysteinyl-tRNA synthetase